MLWLVWVCSFQFFISMGDLWLNSSFVFEATKRGVTPTLIGVSFGVYYVILGLIDFNTGTGLSYLEKLFRKSKFFDGQQRAVFQAFFCSLCLIAVILLSFITHNVVFPILHGCTGFAPMLAIMQTYTQDSCDDDWEFRKNATKAILLGRVSGSVFSLGFYFYFIFYLLILIDLFLFIFNLFYFIYFVLFEINFLINEPTNQFIN